LVSNSAQVHLSTSTPVHTPETTVNDHTTDGKEQRNFTATPPINFIARNLQKAMNDMHGDKSINTLNEFTPERTTENKSLRVKNGQVQVSKEVNMGTSSLLESKKRHEATKSG
jgi:hypothetical protein